MSKGMSEIDINAPADAVWAIVSDFGGIGNWMPGIESCVLKDEHRVLETMGMTITERLVSQDDAGRVQVYSITDGVPVESHEATITVTESGDGSHVTWEVQASPDEMTDLMVGVYQASLEALKAKAEG